MTAGQTNLLKSWEEKESQLEGGGLVTYFTSGDPHLRAIVDAVVDHYSGLAGRPRPTSEELDKWVGSKVTLIQSGMNMIGARLLVAQEGKLFTSSRGGFGILPKGARTKGYRVKEEELLDVIPGYSTDEAIELVRKVRSYFPELVPVTQERFDALPTRSETLSLCVFGSYRMPDSTATDALYLVSNYMREDDIIEGVLLIRPEHGFSEHGSVWGKTLIHGNFGEVVGFQPISFSEGLELCNLDFQEAYGRVVGSLTKV